MKSGDKLNLSSFKIMVTNDCNLSCSYCYVGKKKGTFMDKKTARKLLDFMYKSRDCYISVSFNGGEPLLNPSMVKFITEETSSLLTNCNYSMTTNGTIACNDIIDFLIKYKFDLSISLDGDETSHNLNRKYTSGKGTHRDTLAMIEKLDLRNYGYNIRSTINPNTVDRMYENALYLMSITQMPIIAIINSDPKQWKRKDLEKYKSSLQKIKKYENRLGRFEGEYQYMVLNIGLKKY